jgi:hypothetical protein
MALEGGKNQRKGEECVHLLERSAPAVRASPGEHEGGGRGRPEQQREVGDREGAREEKGWG